MLRVHVRKGLLGEDGLSSHNIPFVDGLTPRVIATTLQDMLPQSLPVDIAVNGELLADNYDDPLSDGDEVIIIPHTTFGIDIYAALVYAFITAIVSAGVSYAIAALSPKPKAPDDTFERGDSSSATYSWNGIQTNYGQGWTVPAIYGRHMTGGQVIETNTEVTLGLGPVGELLNDRVQILLALSEGPIHAIGDREISQDDYLGSISGYPQPPGVSTSLPSDIYVNDVLLTNDSQSGFLVYPLNFGSNNWTPQDPDVNPGDRVYFIDLANPGTNLADPNQTRVWEVTGNSSNPDIKIDNPIPQSAQTIMNAGGTVLVKILFGQTSSFTRRLSLPITAGETLISESAGALAFCRRGDLYQEPLPSAGQQGQNYGASWDGVTTAVNVNRPLNDQAQAVEVSFDTGTDPITGARFIISFPGGLYEIDENAEPTETTVEFEFQWRIVGSGYWEDFTNGGELSFTGNYSTEVATTFEGLFATPQEGNIEFKVTRVSGYAGAGANTRATWRDVVLKQEYSLTYPRTALLGLALQASSRFNGGMPQIRTRVDGILVRVWDASNGFSPRCWDVPAAPFNWHTYPPGRNPAWILLDFLTQPWGLGDYLTEDDLDLPSFAEWAVWCDRDPNPSDPWGEPQFTCDLVLDRPQASWQWVLTICAAGRASPVFLNGKISIVYQYTAAHSQGSVSVPAKTSQQLFTSANTQDLSVNWLPRANRPTAFVYQFLNEDSQYQQDVFTVEDGEGTLNDPTDRHGDKWRPEQQQIFGVTRPSQIFRDGVFRHRVNRLITRRIDFKTGRWALTAHIGDLIDVETEVMRPFDSDVATTGVILVGGSSVSTVTVDHTSLTGTGQLKYRKADGTPGVVNWSSTSATTIDGYACTVLSLASSITVSAGAACVFGKVDKLVETYEITAITLNEDLTRSVTAVEYNAAIHADIAKSTYSAGTDYGLVINDSPASAQTPNLEPYDIQIHRRKDGVQRVSWLNPPLTQSGTKRVYYRYSADQPFRLMATTEHDYVDTTELTPGREVEVRVVLENYHGTSALPDAGVRAYLTATEFTRVQTPQVRSVNVSNRSDLSWAPVTTPTTEEYEIREGTQWVGARTLYRGTQPFVHWEVPPLSTSMTICVEQEDGSQSQPTVIAITPWNPAKSNGFIEHEEIGLGAPGTKTDVALSGSSHIELNSGKLSGVYTTAEKDPGFKATFLWRVETDIRELSTELVDDVLDRCGSGELDWRTVDAREASRYKIGVDFTRDVDDEEETVDSYTDEMAAGYRGVAGRNTRALIEGRFYDGSSWSSWEAWVDQYRNARKAQFRITLDRQSSLYEVNIHKFRTSAIL